MSAHVQTLENVEELRRAFDQTFASPAAPAPDDSDDYVAIRVGGRPLALRVTELTRLEGRGKIVPLPVPTPGLLGLASIQGKLTPIYDIEVLLGYSAGAGQRKWIGVTGKEETLGLAFETLESYLRVSRVDLLSMGAEPSRPHEQQAIRAGGVTRPIVHLPSILASVRERAVQRSRQ